MSLVVDNRNSEHILLDAMPLTVREHTKGAINRAGDNLIGLPLDSLEREQAIEIVDNWRSCHAYPLQVIKMALKQRASIIDETAIIAQRLKRRPSIETKLSDSSTMKLSQMQDLGGCRAILMRIKQVNALTEKYTKSRERNGRSVLVSSKDYIANPKPDGYRGIHLVMKYQTPSDEKAVFNGQKIEIQIRTKLQHAWATAVETAQLFTGQALKTKVKNADVDWLRFFALSSGAFANREGTPVPEGVPDDPNELRNELRTINDKLGALALLRSWTVSISITAEGPHSDDGTAINLLILHTDKHLLYVTPFKRNHWAEAQEAYTTQERKYESASNSHVALVSVDDVKAIRKAYPNYYLDTRTFVTLLDKELVTSS